MLVLYEWRRGPRLVEELAAEAALLGPEAIFGFGEDEARVAADLYRRVGRARGRELDLAIAACALTNGASLWTSTAKIFAISPASSSSRPPERGDGNRGSARYAFGFPSTGVRAREARATAPFSSCIGRCRRMPQAASSCSACGKQRCSRFRP